MTETNTPPSSVEHWDAFWCAREKSTQPEDPGARDRAPAEFWAAFFDKEIAGRADTRLVDVAAGNGAVTAIALDAAAAINRSVHVNCVDYSQSAVAEVCRRFPQVHGVACDARRIPYTDASFDVVVSQFGIEYAGASAFEEAARLVDTDGVLAALVHLKDGAIYKECEDNLAIVDAVNESDFIPLSRAAFAAGFDMIKGKLSDSEFQEFDRRLAPSVNAVKAILGKTGPMAVGGLLANAYRDIAYMYQRIQNYVPAEVFDWIDGVANELASYEGRMASMTACALDEAGISRVADNVAASGLAVQDIEQLSLEATGKPAAWILVARRTD